MTIASHRKEYTAGRLRERGAPADPMVLFRRWFQVAMRSDILEPTAMSIATVDQGGRPSSRMVLLKEVDHGFVFCTSQRSRKGRELRAGAAALLFWWPPLERQVRIEGRVREISAAESDALFALRPRGARLAAWASYQSRPVADRRALESALARMTRRFAGRDVPRPSHWCGYRVVPRRIEFWQGGLHRLHDRLLYRRGSDSWTRVRLSP